MKVYLLLWGLLLFSLIRTYDSRIIVNETLLALMQQQEDEEAEIQGNGLLLNRVSRSLKGLVFQKPNVHRCVHAARKIGKQGDGTTVGSCTNCDPTYGTCAFGCQALVNYYYHECDHICLPDGYFFDPSM